MLLQKSRNTLSNYTLTNPVKLNGTLTNYGKILLYAYHSKSTYTKVQLLETCLNKNFCGGKGEGYCSGTFAILNLNDLISYNTKTKKLENGVNLNEYVETFILPFVK